MRVGNEAISIRIRTIRFFCAIGQISLLDYLYAIAHEIMEHREKEAWYKKNKEWDVRCKRKCQGTKQLSFGAGKAKLEATQKKSEL